MGAATVVSTVILCADIDVLLFWTSIANHPLAPTPASMEDIQTETSPPSVHRRAGHRALVSSAEPGPKNVFCNAARFHGYYPRGQRTPQCRNLSVHRLA